MIDIKEFRDNPGKFEKAAKEKGININSSEIIALDEKYRALLAKVEGLRSERNVVAKERNIERGKEIKDELSKVEAELATLEDKVKIELLNIPNPAKEDVKVGKDDSENEVVKKEGEPKKFNFTPLDHLELGEKLEIIDTQRASKVSGARFTYLKNEAVALEFALVRFAMDTLTKEGFTPIIPPVLVKRATMEKLGYMEHGGADDMFYIEKDDLILIGTAEHAIVSMHESEVLSLKKPLRYVGFSTSFRREAGSYGKDTRGILRLHQFDKVEMVSFVKKGEDDREHEYLLGLEEGLFKSLEIPYQVVKMCTGDLGFPAARKYDIEAWMPAQNKYREVTSVSTVTDFQSRRLNTKYQEGDGKEFANILNGTAFAVGRTLIAILENYQQKDGTVMIPEVLQKYTGFDKIEPKN